MTPVLDDGEREIAVLLVAECTVEAGEQPAAKHQREAQREQRERQQAVALVECRCATRGERGHIGVRSQSMVSRRLFGRPARRTAEKLAGKPATPAVAQLGIGRNAWHDVRLP
jgi:hypothetical protein